MASTDLRDEGIDPHQSGTRGRTVQREQVEVAKLAVRRPEGRLEGSGGDEGGGARQVAVEAEGRHQADECRREAGDD